MYTSNEIILNTQPEILMDAYIGKKKRSLYRSRNLKCQYTRQETLFYDEKHL